MESNINNCDKKIDSNLDQSKKSFKARKSEYIGLNALNIFKENSNLPNNLMRKYSFNPKIYIKNFVPVLGPKENDLNIIPTKLTLNKKRKSSTLSNASSSNEDDGEDKCKEELNLNNNFVNSVSSNSSFSSKNDENNKINKVRKNFTKIKKHSVFRKNSRNSKTSKTLKINLVNEKNNEEECDSCSNDEMKESDNSPEYNNLIKMPKKSFHFLSSFKNNENKIFNNFQKKNRNRINSFSILETLQNKLKLDK